MKRAPEANRGRSSRVSAITVMTVAAAVTLATVPCTAAELEILIPWYNYPNWWDPTSYRWDDLAAGASQVPITAVINPSNGPGTGGPNTDYQIGLADLAGAGVTMVGYVFTSFGTRPIDDAKDDIDEYALHYTGHGVSGIFFDEVSSGAADLDYYEELYLYVLAQPGLSYVIVNPGTQVDEGFLTRPAADTIVGFENFASVWPGHTPPAYMSNYAAGRFSVLLHEVADAAAMRTAVDLAVDRNFGRVYLTDDVLPNPWDTLAAFWQDELDEIEEVNQRILVDGFESGNTAAWSQTVP